MKRCPASQPFELEADQAAETAAQVGLGAALLLALVVAGVDHPRDRRMAFQILGHGGCVAAVLAHPQRQGLQALDELEGVERADRVAQVALQGDPRLEDVGDRPERLGGLGPDRAVVARVGPIQQREALGVLLPVEAAAVDDDAADRGAVPADVLGRRVNDDVGAVVERPADNGRRRVVDDQRHAQLLADLGDLADREDPQLRVRQGLGVVGAGARVGRPAEVLRVARVDEADLDAEAVEGVGEEVPGAAVEVGRADDVVARARDVLDRHGRGRLARGDRERRDPAIERGDALLEHVAGRVRDPGVDVAELLEREEIRRMPGVIELVRRGLVDRHRDRAGGRVVAVTGVQDHGFRMFRRRRHDHFPSSRFGFGRRFG
jgi:hypothetical protein